jgi:tetratricopeptide (TPR) repeat protein
MAKARRTTARTSKRKPARQRPAKRGASARTRTRTQKRPTAAARRAVAAPVQPSVVQAPAPQASAPAPARKPTYHEAVGLYERGLQALQRRDFGAAANALRLVIQQYPDERELLERARLYLKVCERELEPREPVSRTADEWVYEATVALNADQEAVAVQHLQRALTENPRHDHAHYMMAVASARRGDRETAVEHLRHAVTLNPENRALARQDPDLDALRELEAFREALDASSAAVSADTTRPAAPQARKIRR